MIQSLNECLCAMAQRRQLEKSLALIDRELAEPHRGRARAAVEYRIARISEEIRDFGLRATSREVEPGAELGSIYFVVSLGGTRKDAVQLPSPPRREFGWSPLTAPVSA